MFAAAGLVFLEQMAARKPRALERFEEVNNPQKRARQAHAVLKQTDTIS